MTNKINLYSLLTILIHVISLKDVAQATQDPDFPKRKDSLQPSLIKHSKIAHAPSTYTQPSEDTQMHYDSERDTFFYYDPEYLAKMRGDKISPQQAKSSHHPLVKKEFQSSKFLSPLTPKKIKVKKDVISTLKRGQGQDTREHMTLPQDFEKLLKENEEKFLSLEKDSFLQQLYVRKLEEKFHYLTNNNKDLSQKLHAAELELKFLKDIFYPTIMETLNLINPLEREDISRWTKELSTTTMNKEDVKYIIEALAKVEPPRREEISLETKKHFSEETGDGERVMFIITAANKIAEEKNSSLGKASTEEGKTQTPSYFSWLPFVNKDK